MEACLPEGHRHSSCPPVPTHAAPLRGCCQCGLASAFDKNAVSVFPHTPSP